MTRSECLQKPTAVNDQQVMNVNHGKIVSATDISCTSLSRSVSLPTKYHTQAIVWPINNFLTYHRES